MPSAARFSMQSAQALVKGLVMAVRASEGAEAELTTIRDAVTSENRD
jgi:hypothetical protein